MFKFTSCDKSPPDIYHRGTIMVHLHVITAVLVILALGSGGLTAAASHDLPLIQWPVGCSQYSEPVSERAPRVIFIHSQYSTKESLCRSLCTSRQDCGGFVMYVSGSYNACMLYNINDDVISDHLNDNWFWSSSSNTWHSKSCRPYSVSVSDVSCDQYKDKYQKNQYIRMSSVWVITYTDWSVPNLTQGQCQSWCTLYPGCRSVTYLRYISYGEGRCCLYTTTIEELMESDHSDDVYQFTGSYSTYTTYDRYCGQQPYIPE